MKGIGLLCEKIPMLLIHYIILQFRNLFPVNAISNLVKWHIGKKCINYFLLYIVCSEVFLKRSFILLYFVVVEL